MTYSSPSTSPPPFMPFSSLGSCPFSVLPPPHSHRPLARLFPLLHSHPSPPWHPHDLGISTGIRLWRTVSILILGERARSTGASCVIFYCDTSDHLTNSIHFRVPHAQPPSRSINDRYMQPQTQKTKWGDICQVAERHWKCEWMRNMIQAERAAFLLCKPSEGVSDWSSMGNGDC
ncbi:hypothetical protein OG21DRAFT_297129 [Imleria badia]|nr:hypothetical protein OG21DRAFT_297129 [Imleria badia]